MNARSARSAGLTPSAIARSARSRRRPASAALTAAGMRANGAKNADRSGSVTSRSSCAGRRSIEARGHSSLRATAARSIAIASATARGYASSRVSQLS